MASNFKKDKSKIRSVNCYYVINGRKRYKQRNMSLYLRYAKAQNKYMKDYDKGKEFSYLEYWDVQAFSK